MAKVSGLQSGDRHRSSRVERRASSQDESLRYGGLRMSARLCRKRAWVRSEGSRRTPEASYPERRSLLRRTDEMTGPTHHFLRESSLKRPACGIASATVKLHIIPPHSYRWQSVFRPDLSLSIYGRLGLAIKVRVLAGSLGHT